MKHPPQATAALGNAAVEEKEEKGGCRLVPDRTIPFVRLLFSDAKGVAVICCLRVVMEESVALKSFASFLLIKL